MYGLIGKIETVEGGREELAGILSSITSMPGCLSYIVAEDVSDSKGLWVTEVWETAEAHGASLDLPEVQAAMARGRSLIAAFDTRVETRPLGGVGLA